VVVGGDCSPGSAGGAGAPGVAGLVVGVDGLVVVGPDAVTVNVCGVYCVSSDGKPSVKQSAATAAGNTAAPAGTVNDPCQDPFAATGMSTDTGNVGAATRTKSCAATTVNPGAHPSPLTDTTVPGGPDGGVSVNDVTAASAAVAPYHAQAPTSSAIPISAQRRAGARRDPCRSMSRLRSMLWESPRPGVRIGTSERPIEHL
jgi:hypothetical protein